jgi:hypothetical protein
LVVVRVLVGLRPRKKRADFRIVCDSHVGPFSVGVRSVVLLGLAG